MNRVLVPSNMDKLGNLIFAQRKPSTLFVAEPCTTTGTVLACSADYRSRDIRIFTELFRDKIIQKQWLHILPK